MPVIYYLHRGFGIFRCYRALYAICGFVAVYFQSLVIYHLLLATGWMDPSQALLVAVITLIFPSFQTGNDSAIVPQYLFPVTAFYGGWWLVFLGEDFQGGTYWLIKVLSMSLIWFGFYCNATLVLHLAMVFVWILIQWGSGQELISILKGAGVNISLPFIFWIVKEKWTPRHGIYKNYNRVKFDSFHYAVAFYTMIQNGFCAPIQESWIWVRRSGLVLFVIAGLGIWGLTRPFGVCDWEQENSLLQIAVSLFLWMAGAFAYIAVGKSFARKGIFTRNAILFSLPIALLLTAVMKSIVTLDPSLQGLVECLVGMGIGSWIFYGVILGLEWEGQTAIYEGILLRLRQKGNYEEVSIWGVIDQLDLDLPTPERASMVWSYLFERAWNNRKAFAIYGEDLRTNPKKSEQISECIEDTTLGYDFQEVNTNGRQGTIRICRGKYFQIEGWWRNPAMIGLLYLKCRFIQKKGKQDFLSSLIIIK